MKMKSIHLMLSRLRVAGLLTLALAGSAMAAEEELTGTSGDRCISGVYPHLTAYAMSLKSGAFTQPGLGETGIGAVIPWAGKLWMITYAGHKPTGSPHKLYSIDDRMNMTIHPESVGGTPAARMIHDESQQLIIGPYFIDKTGKVRVISPKVMPGRLTAIARHLTDPANKVYVYGMEGEVYEVEVHTLAVTRLFDNPVPGWHGKGAYSAQGLLVVANNGETGFEGKDDKPEQWKVNRAEFDPRKSPEEIGSLATFDGTTWKVIERKQYTDVTGPQGVHPTAAGKDLPLWTIGWDRRSLRLQVLDGGKFHLYLLPKAVLNNDPSHGWYTEWPRIREIGDGKAMMDMHGMFWDFPLDFRPGHTGGLAPIGRHLRYIPDFCAWNGKLVLAADESTIFDNPLCGQPQSNLWIGSPSQIRNWGEASATGAIWVQDPVAAGTVSAPFLIKGFKKRIAHFVSDQPTAFTLEIDRDGSGRWEPYATVDVPTGYVTHLFPAYLDAQWVRVTNRNACTATVAFSFSDTRSHDPAGPGATAFAAFAEVGSADVPRTHWLSPDKDTRDLLVATVESGKVVAQHRLGSESLAFAPATLPDPLLKILPPAEVFTVDAASVMVTSGRRILRLPKGDAAYDKPFVDGWPRAIREVESERKIANIHGTFYEVPQSSNSAPPSFYRMKPISSHHKQIMDYCSWHGLLLLSGVKEGTPAANNIFRSEDGKQILWAGCIDDLWQLGKPVGHGGPWKDTAVKAFKDSDPYLMNGYDRKDLTLSADKDCNIKVLVDFDLQSGFHVYKTFPVKAGAPTTFTFPDGFAAHWVRFVSDKDVTATAWLEYR